jgi:phage FluMu protein Com
MKVIERGTARCPRCMTLAEYQFFDRGDDTLSYEVRCDACKNVYVEITEVYIEIADVPAPSAA